MKTTIALLLFLTFDVPAVDRIEIGWGDQTRTYSVDPFIQEFPQNERLSLDPHFKESEHKNGGTYLKDLMTALDIPSDLTRVRIDAYDGYQVEFDAEPLNPYDPMITVKLDGEIYNGKNWLTYRGQGLGSFYLTLDSKRFPEIRNKKYFRYWIFAMKRIQFLGKEAGLVSLNRDISGWPEKPRTGGQLFLKNCVTCHQFQGNGGTKGPAISDSIYNEETDREDFIRFVQSPDENIPMPRFSKRLAPDEIGSIFDLYRFIQARNQAE